VRGRAVGLSLAMVITAVVIQTAVFGDTRINPFGAAPAFVLLVVIACVRYVDPEPALLMGFTAGLLVDLLGGSPLGLWAMAYTVVVGLGVFLLTILSNVLFLMMGTLFGERFLSSGIVIKQTVLPAVYNVGLAVVVFPAVTKLIGERGHRRWSR